MQRTIAWLKERRHHLAGLKLLLELSSSVLLLLQLPLALHLLLTQLVLQLARPLLALLLLHIAFIKLGVPSMQNLFGVWLQQISLWWCMADW